MSLSSLKKLAKLVPGHMMPFFTDVTLAREISETCWFSDICLSIIELLVLCNYTQTALKLIIDTFLFFKKQKLVINSLLKQASQACIEKNIKELKKLIYGEDLFRMIEACDKGFSKKQVKSLKDLDKFLRFAKVKVVELRIACSELHWGCKEANFSVFFANVNGKLLFLHKNKRLRLNTPEIKLDYCGNDELKKLENQENIEFLSGNECLEIEEPYDGSFYIQKALKSSKPSAKLFMSNCPFPVSPCGSFLCQICSKRLKRSTFFIINPKCCNYFIFNTPNVDPQQSEPSDNQASSTFPSTSEPLLCSFCSKPGSKKEQILCICCILNKFIYKDQLKPFDSCQKSEPTEWIDINSGPCEVFSKCGFCDNLRNSLFMSSVCYKCLDQVCLPCLRKNPFISEGLCSSCNKKRQVNFMQI